MKGRQKTTRTNHSGRIYDHCTIPLLNLRQNTVPISLASISFPTYFTTTNRHEHIKRKHDCCIVFVGAATKMLPMITNSRGLFCSLRVRTEAPKKQRVTHFCLCLPVPITDARHTRINRFHNQGKRLPVQNTCLKSREEAMQVLQHTSNLFNFFPRIKSVTNETVYD